MLDVKNKWALITGASRGIGQRLAVFMAEKGCNLILHSRTLEALQTTQDLIKSYGIQSHGLAAELSDPDQVDQLLKAVDALPLEVDFVFNNAGIQVAYRNDYLHTPDEDFTTSFLINTIAPMKICYHFLPKMQERGFGRIINTTSGIQGEPQQAGYSASKAALDKVTLDLAGTLNNVDISINLVDPGWCQTDLGGPYAPNTPESTLPGVALAAFAPAKLNGQILSAQDYSGLSLREALNTLEA